MDIEILTYLFSYALLLLMAKLAVLSTPMAALH